jgi:sugar phosphate isomerase/epimerase
MSTIASPIIAVSSWALHHELGSPPFWGVGAEPSGSKQLQQDLLALPAQVAARGIQTMELCHFHLSTLDNASLRDFRKALDNAGVTLHALLVDDGDITNEETGHRDLEWINEWFPIAAELGAQKVRVIAGKTTDKDAVSKSAMLLRLMSRYAETHNLRLTTENWYPVLSTPDAVLQLLQETEGRVGLNLDFGNWDGPTKYDDLAAIAPHAESCHAKANFEDLSVKADDYAHCLNLPYPDDFRGPFTLVAGGRDNDWQGIEATRDFIQDHFSGNSS